MRELAPGLWQLTGLLPYLSNVYLIEGPSGRAADATECMLVDAGTRWRAGPLLRQLRGRALSLVALTHCHPDHQGSAAAVCRRFGVPLACHELDAPVMEGREPMRPRKAAVRLADRLWSGPAHPVAVRWRGGENVGGFRVVHTPGHTPGHVLLFRQRDGVALVGDLLCNVRFWRGPGRLVEPPRVFSVDPEQNRRSVRLLLELGPTLLCFGHGPPLRCRVTLERYLARLDAGAAPARPFPAAVGVQPAG
jgi:glyoxylase-like metal-dependent hydrolase (beta-lactamase superfamily II)